MDLQRLAAETLDRAAEPILWVDADGRILFANEAAVREFQQSRDALEMRRVFEIAPELDGPLWRELWREIQRAGALKVEISCRAGGGRTFPAELSAHRMQNTAPEIACLFLRDISEQQRLQDLKNEFISTVSHELRSPLTIVREGVSQVMDGLRGELTPEQRRALSIALTGIDRLARIIKDVLDISRLETGKMRLRREWVNLGEVLEEVAASFKSQAVEQGLALRVEAPEAVKAFVDRDKIIQVLTNLVVNGLKFTAQGGVTLTARAFDDHVECAVADTGPGIDPEKQRRIFNKFEQLDATPLKGERGSGLGLYICKGIVELHHGRIQVESEKGRGTTFRFTLPNLRPAEIFRLQVSDPLHHAAESRGTVSLVRWALNGNAAPALVDQLEQLILIHSGRRGDICVKDSEGIWLGMPGVSRKEALRVAEHVRGAEGSGTPEITVVNYPEDAIAERELFRKLFHEES